MKLAQISQTLYLEHHVGNELIVTTVPDAGVGNIAYFTKSREFSYEIFGEVGEIAPFSVTKSQSSEIMVRGTIALDGAITASGNSTGANLGAVGATENVMQLFIVQVLVVLLHQQLLLNYNQMTIQVLQVQLIGSHLLGSLLLVQTFKVLLAQLQIHIGV